MLTECKLCKSSLVSVENDWILSSEVAAWRTGRIRRTYEFGAWIADLFFSKCSIFSLKVTGGISKFVAFRMLVGLSLRNADKELLDYWKNGNNLALDKRTFVLGMTQLTLNLLRLFPLDLWHLNRSICPISERRNVGMECDISPDFE